MSQPTDVEMTVDKNVMVPMRDGMRLETDIYRPPGPGPFPALVSRSPYGRTAGRAGTGADFWVPLGYAYVTQDCRGRFGSEGDYTPHLSEGPDGYDTIEWVAEQPWCNGAVGTTGQSYLGADQYQLAPHNPPHLRAMAPVSGTCDHRQSWTRHAGGALEHGWMVPYALLKGRNTLERKGLAEEQMETLDSYLDPPDEHGFFAQPLTPEGYAHVPLTDWAERMKDIAPYFAEYLEHPEDGPYWWEINVRRGFHTIDTPMLHFGLLVRHLPRRHARGLRGRDRPGRAQRTRQPAPARRPPGGISATRCRPAAGAASSISGPRPRSISCRSSSAGSGTGSRARTRGLWTKPPCASS